MKSPINMQPEYRDELKTRRKARKKILADARKAHTAGTMKITAIHRELDRAAARVDKEVARIDRRIAILEGRRQ